MFWYSVKTMEKNNLKQRYAIKFCLKLGEGTTDTYKKIQKAFDNDSISLDDVFRCHEDFVNGQETGDEL
jgi:hypothetical protein